MCEFTFFLTPQHNTQDVEVSEKSDHCQVWVCKMDKMPLSLQFDGILHHLTSLNGMTVKTGVFLQNSFRSFPESDQRVISWKERMCAMQQGCWRWD
jgi:hypothetical protein